MNLYEFITNDGKVSVWGFNYLSALLVLKKAFGYCVNIQSVVIRGKK